MMVSRHAACGKMLENMRSKYGNLSFYFSLISVKRLKVNYFAVFEWVKGIDRVHY